MSDNNVPGDRFTCAECGYSVPVEYRHEEKPTHCFLCWISEADQVRLEQIFAENEAIWAKIEAKNGH